MTTLQLTDINHIAGKLLNHVPEILKPNDRGHASVSLILRSGEKFPEVLFIIRAQHDDDPWSGNIGFPGGRLNNNGESAREAAERESFEELCLELNKANFLGQLDDLYGATLPVMVSCFVYHLDQKPPLKPNHEVASTFWCPLPRLLEKSRHTHECFTYRGEARFHPVVKLLEPDQPLLWGITYRLLRNFFAICEIEFGASEPP